MEERNDAMEKELKVLQNQRDELYKLCSILLKNVGGKVIITNTQLVETDFERFSIVYENNPTKDQMTVHLSEISNVKNKCTCNQKPHRVSCPLGFDNYFPDRFALHAKVEHPKDCKGCPDCPGTYTCKCGKEFDELNTEHECVKRDNGE